MQERYGGWWGALTVMVVTATLVVLDIGDGSVHRYWSRHSFASSVLSGLLVLLLTVLIVDRVTRLRQLRSHSRAIAAQAAVIVGQAARTADSVARTSSSGDDHDEASEELRTYTQMLLTSAPVLIDAEVSRTFLETAQRLAAQLFRALRDGGDETAQQRKTRLDTAVEQLGEPLLLSWSRSVATSVRPPAQTKSIRATPEAKRRLGILAQPAEPTQSDSLSATITGEGLAGEGVLRRRAGFELTRDDDFVPGIRWVQVTPNRGPLRRSRRAPARREGCRFRTVRSLQSVGRGAQTRP
jgi:hypothetical protein